MAKLISITQTTQKLELQLTDQRRLLASMCLTQARALLSGQIDEARWRQAKQFRDLAIAAAPELEAEIKRLTPELSPKPQGEATD